MIDNDATIEVTLRDSAGTGISGATLTPTAQKPVPDLAFSSAAANPITAASLTTNSTGRATVTVVVGDWLANNTDVITASGLGAAAQQTFNVTTESLTFITPDSGAEVDIGTNEVVTVQWLAGGNPVPNDSSVCFATTRGTFPGELTSISVTTSGGQATTNISATSSGRATITATTGSCESATASSLEAKREILFIATVPAKLDLQANPDVIGIGEQSNLVAVVPDDQRYAKPYSVMVTDSSGHSVGGIDVALALWATHYHKGFYTWGGTAWVQNITAANCPNEDVNRDGYLNPGEDYNGNGLLDPGAVATIHKQLGGGSIYTVTTDANGFADFYILYTKDRALWSGVELTASTLVQGTESTRRVYFTLPILAADLINENVPPPGASSPFGIAGNCADPN